MYTFSKRLKTFALVLMVFGALGMALGLWSAPKTVEQAKSMVVSHDTHGEAAAHEAAPAHEKQVVVIEGHEIEVGGSSSHPDSTEESHSADHDTHLLHQLQNKPWAAIYVAALFALMISLGVLAFYGINRAAQAGWSPLLFRVMEGITSYLLPGGILLLLILVLTSLHFNHLFVWMDPEVVAHDALIQGKSGFLNVPGFLVRSVIYLSIWIGYQKLSRKFSLAEDNDTTSGSFVKNFRLSAAFLVLFLISESMMSWDWIMSVDPHWFSTLFGWYVFASLFVSGITVIAMVTIYLKSKGLLPEVNNSHIHDLAKFMFGISVFWTYLWFSQFMLIWYSNIPEEVTYFVTRIEDFKVGYFGMVAMNFLLPLLLLMNSDYKRLNWLVFITGIVILVGHYFDVYHMIMPATVGDQASFGLTELAAVAFFAGLFIFVVFTSIASAPITPKNHPLIEESKHFHY
ncbi:MAG: quinol:cytochrome C oxidoreductase [Flavobacteriaceae bacterium]